MSFHKTLQKVSLVVAWVVIILPVLLFGWFIVLPIHRRLQIEKKQEDAIHVLRAIRAAEASFKMRAAKFGTMRELIDAGLLRSSVVDGVADDYGVRLFSTSTTFEVIVTPARQDDAYAYVGLLSFFLDESGVIRHAVYGRDNGYRAPNKGDQPNRYQ